MRLRATVCPTRERIPRSIVSGNWGSEGRTLAILRWPMETNRIAFYEADMTAALIFAHLYLRLDGEPMHDKE